MSGNATDSYGKTMELYSLANVHKLNMHLGYDQPQQDNAIRGERQLIDWILFPIRVNDGIFM